MRIRVFSAILATLIVWTTGANAQSYIGTRTEWEKLSSDDKATYAMGLFDGLNINLLPASNDQIALRLGRHKCMKDLSLDSGNLAQIVNEGYAADAATWGNPPIILILNQLRKVCKRQISAERVKLGLKPLT